MTIVFCGIDPGAHGAVAYVSESGTFLTACDLTREPRDLWLRLSRPLPPLTEIHIALEEPFAFAGQGHNPAEQFRAFGWIEGVLACTGLPVTKVRAQTWKREMGLKLPKDTDPEDKRAALKQLSRDMARCLWPEARLAKQGGIVKESWAEAGLLGEWLRRKERGRLPLGPRENR